MAKLRASAEQIQDFILDTVERNPHDIARVAGERWGLSRQAISRHLKALVAKGLLDAKGKTRARQYETKTFVEDTFSLLVSTKLEEDVVWRNSILPKIGDMPENVLKICNHGFTEILNNAVSHSEGKVVVITIERKGIWVEMRIFDNGVGIFEKIQRDLHLNDTRHALLELSKGKLTTDPQAHTGEGIFFTSRMFDQFSILSSTLFYTRTRANADDWLIEVENRNKVEGTMITMRVKTNSIHTIQETFDRYVSGQEDYTFSKTHVPVMLAKYDRDQLLSRSAARRVLARFEKFREVILDFQGVESIGQAFADEIFRVFKREHPEIAIYPFNVNTDVQKVIQHAVANELATI